MEGLAALNVGHGLAQDVGHDRPAIKGAKLVDGAGFAKLHPEITVIDVVILELDPGIGSLSGLPPEKWSSLK